MPEILKLHSGNGKAVEVQKKLYNCSKYLLVEDC